MSVLLSASCKSGLLHSLFLFIYRISEKLKKSFFADNEVVFPSITPLTAVNAVKIEIKNFNFTSVSKTYRYWRYEFESLSRTVPKFSYITCNRLRYLSLARLRGKSVITFGCSVLGSQYYTFNCQKRTVDLNLFTYQVAFL